MKLVLHTSVIQYVCSMNIMNINKQISLFLSLSLSLFGNPFYISVYAPVYVCGMHFPCVLIRHTCHCYTCIAMASDLPHSTLCLYFIILSSGQLVGSIKSVLVLSSSSSTCLNTTRLLCSHLRLLL